MKDKKNNDLLNEIIKIGKENILDLDLNSTKFGDIMNNLDKKGIVDNPKKTHQKCNTSISNEEFTNQMMKEINSGGLDEIYEILNEQDNEESANKSHSRHNTETFDYLRFSNYQKPNNIKEFQFDNRKTVDVFDKLHVYDNIDDDSDVEEENNLNASYKDEEEGDGDLGTIMGMQLEQFNNENEGILLNENGQNLIDDLKNEKKFVKTGTKIDIVEEIEGKIFNGKRTYKELEKYITKIDDNIDNKNEIGSISSKKLPKKIIYDMLSTTNNTKLYEDLSKHNGVIFVFDKNNNIFCSTEKGNITIYNLKEEKKIKELENPFKENSKNDSISIITAMSTDEKYIICAYNNGKIALFRKGREKLNKTKLFITIKETSTKSVITEIKVYSGKKDRIIFYFLDKNCKIYRYKIYKGMFKKNKKHTHMVINSYNNYQLYNLEINPYSYKCFGICNFKGVFIYNIKKNENKLLFNKIQDLDNKYYPNFCFIKSLNEKEKSKFMVSINPDSVILCEINSNFTNTIQLNKYMIKDPIIKIGVFINELVYVFDKANQITLINCTSETHKITQKFTEDNSIFLDKKSFRFRHIEELSLYQNIFCNTNRNIIINSSKKILLITPLTLTECINKICEKNDNNKWSILFYLCNQIYKKKHPIWTKNDYEKCLNLIIEKINICLNEIITKNQNDKIEQLKNVLEFLFNVELYDYITSEKDELYTKIKDDKIYFSLLEPYILQNKMKNIKLPIIFINRLIDFYVKTNKKSWLCELLIHLDIKLFCDKKSANKNGLTLFDIFDKNNLLNILLYIILKNYELYKEYTYCTPIINIFLNLIKESKNIKAENLMNQFNEIISKNNEYNEIIENTPENNNEEKIDIDKINSKNDFIENNKYNDDLLYSNHYLRLKLFWYIYTVLFCKGVNETNKKKCQELIDKSIDIIFNPQIYEILETNKEDENKYIDNNENNDNPQILNLDLEIRLIINKLFKDELISEFCELNKEDIIQKLESLVNKGYISYIAFYLICLKSLLDDHTLEINKETKLNILLFFMNENHDNDKYKEIKSEKFEMDLIELIKNIDSFTFDDTDKIINASNSCKEKYPKLSEYIINNFKK